MYTQKVQLSALIVWYIASRYVTMETRRTNDALSGDVTEAANIQTFARLLHLRRWLCAKTSFKIGTLRQPNQIIILKTKYIF